MSQKIGFVFNQQPGHAMSGHPEHPDRFSRFLPLSNLAISDALQKISSARTDETALRSAHTAEYIDQVKNAVQLAPTRLDTGDTYVTADSWQAALGSVSGAIAAAEYGLEQGQIGFSLSRPPGHHATASRAMGFCLFNNAAIAARHLQANNDLERILIVDFDVHHGNGTQAIFEDDPTVFYFSTHQQGIFPGTGSLAEIGRGPGEGTIQNIPLPAFTGERGFLKIFEPVFEQVCQRFQPEFLLISAGYDAHWRDPLANMLLSCETYYSIAKIVRQASEQYCGGRMSLVLEGGYDPEALFHSVLHTMHGLLGTRKPEDPLGKPNRPEADIMPLMEQLLHP